jgi:hypothetical protein
MSGFGAGLGQVIGSGMASGAITAGQGAVNNNVGGVEQQTAPFVGFGQGQIPNAGQAITNIAGTAGTAEGYNQFISSYQNTPAAKYQMQQADAVQNSSAAAKGDVLSGANERALGTINEGIGAQNANTAYDEYLKGNNQNFGQLESSLGNMFNAIGVGTTGTGQDVSAVNGQNTATAALTGQQAQAQTAKGNGIGSIFGSLMPKVSV